MSNLYPKIVVCEGRSESAYIQELNRILVRGPYATPYVAAIPDSGHFLSIKRCFKEQRKKNRKMDVLIWADKDIYLREPKDRREYEQRSPDIPEFYFSVLNFEDFLVLHLEQDKIEFWEGICREHGHFDKPLTGEQHLALFTEHMFPAYSKGTLPFALTKERLEALFLNLERPHLPFGCDFLNFVRQEIEEKTLRFI